jgi:DNA repair protein SbcC/Rad50
LDAELRAIKGEILRTNSASEAVAAELAERFHQFTLADRLADAEALILRYADLAKEASAAIVRESVANETAKGLEASTGAVETQIDKDNSELERLATVVQALQSEAETLDESALQADEVALTELHRQARDSQQLAEKYSLATSRRYSGHASNMQAADAVTNAIARFEAATAEGLEQSNRRAEVYRHAELAEESIQQRNAHLRSLLVEGENCPICGATEHPYATAGAIDALTLLAEDLRRQRAAIDKAIAASNNAAQQAATDCATAEGRVETALRQESQASREIEDALAEFRGLRETMVPFCQQYGFAAMLSAELGNGAASQLAGLVATCEQACKAVAQRVAAVRDLRRRLDAAAKARQAAQTALNIANQLVSQKRTVLHDSRLELARASDATALFQARTLEFETELVPYFSAAQVPIESLRVDAAHALTTLRVIAAEVEASRGRSTELLTEESRLNAAYAQKAALRQQAAVHSDELESLLANRIATRQALETQRGDLLGGEATSQHRTRFNNARVTAQNALDQAQTATIRQAQLSRPHSNRNVLRQRH